MNKLISTFLLSSSLITSCQPPPDTPIKSDATPVNTNSVVSGDTLWGIYNVHENYMDIRKSLTPGFADFRTELPKDKKIYPMIGDWGHGQAIALFDDTNCTFVFYKGLSAEVIDYNFSLGCIGQHPQAISGDWNGDGKTKVGIYFSDLGVAVLSQDNINKENVIKFEYGEPNADLVALTGDWNNDGLVTLGLWNPHAHRFDLINSNSAGVAEVSFETDKAMLNVVPFSILEKNAKSSVGLYSGNTGLFHIFSTESYAETGVIEFGAKNSISLPVFWK